MHAISSFTYWPSYVEEDMSLDYLHWITSIIISLLRTNTNYPTYIWLVSSIQSHPCNILFHILALMWKTICPWMPLDWINSIITCLTRINTNYHKWSVLFKVIHGITSFTYWHIYVEHDMSMNYLDSIKSIFTSLTHAKLN